MESKYNASAGKKVRWYFFIIGLFLGTVLTSTFSFMNDNQDSLSLTNNAVHDDDDLLIDSAIYFPLEAFTLNLTSANQPGGRVLYIGLTLKLNDKKSQENVKELLPEIRSHLLVLFSQQIVSELLTAEGKQKLANETKELINQLFVGKQQVEVIDVLFNAFILR